MNLLPVSATSSLKNKRILITCGPTWISIDAMRVVSNQSTGELGQTLAKNLQKQKARVTVIEGAVQRPLTEKGIRILKFRFYNELLASLKKELKRNSYDAVIQAAAVSDFQLKKRFKQKIDSKTKTLKLTFTPTKKIINLIKTIQPKTFLVGFKLRSTLSVNSLKATVKDLFQKARCDLVVANTLTAKQYHAYIVNPQNKVLDTAHSRSDLSKKLTKILNNQLCTDSP